MKLRVTRNIPALRIREIQKRNREGGKMLSINRRLEMKSEYTKGEWYLELRPADNVRRVRCGSESIADVFGTNAEDKANAHLIAQAPKLYEALKEIYETELNADVIRILQPWLSKVEQAIASVEDK